MEMVNCKINGIAVSVPKGSTILEAARAAGVEIPTLCYMKKINEIGACRICIVEATGARGLVTACVYPVSEGMEVKTNTPKVQAARRTTLELLLSTHDKKCLSCSRSTNCELQKLCREYGVEESRFEGYKPHYELDTSTPHLVRDNNKCILCRRCVAVCREQYVSVIGPNDRGIDTSIGTAFKVNLSEVPCISCGQCAAVCPTGAITEKDDTDKVWEALGDPTKHVVVQTAPSVRATLGECFGMPIGTNVEGKMVSALRRLGFDRVFDTDFAADLTIVEEANELVERIKNKGTLPMITSCSPGWIKFCEYYYPDMLDHLSSCKSPQQMAGAVIKTYYAEKAGIDPKDIVSVSVMPCTAKKFEIGREDQSASGYPDVDIAITTRELARMIERAGLKFTSLPDEEFDSPLGEDTGAAVIFGATGGVMEAALRTANDWLTGKDNLDIDFTAVRGTDSIKEASVDIAGMTVKVAVASGGNAANEIMKKVRSGEADWTFIEIMGCPGGCVNGGGQPIQPQYVRDTVDLKAVRAKALYDQDAAMTLRKSHESPVVKALYSEWYDGFGGHKAHHDLHTSYVARKR
ncbi:MAG: NADH-dependent [FeFe] hydrogenase, group A6 [Firmicutes bacterium]|uniref:NADH-dependent [FeFe] hydrogenase, group A6 n=1 Tax=Candidatus Colimorpha enterica TaxID=3083063 RepID=A0AAE3JZY7_9BACT|nr:[FeFe] hydrogenase, group A [Candidatus Colimorpha enterica]MCI5755716.1 NADH-dependent [FeFe] hydrogenase, group A6 [Candidatus Colimorpha enterica]MDD6322939.1 NADH-dependent [FeFe] hydrogenase, group A6 [Bacillota bacterium]MDY2907344.1 NADH-dependent [FeFe] hydrogenase, group A6 [Eubacteriales bacterium]